MKGRQIYNKSIFHKAIYIVLILFVHIAGKAQKGPIHQLIQNPGQLITCAVDSGSLLSADTIMIYYAPEGSKYIEMNMFCTNFPQNDSLQHKFMWPASIEFAEEKYFAYKYRRKQKTNSGNEISVIFDASKFYLGEYILDEKQRTLMLEIWQINWKQKFDYHYNKKSRQLTLIKHQN